MDEPSPPIGGGNDSGGNDTDRISALPDQIIHNHILYRLEDPKQVARTSLLSRRWLQLWRSYPVLEFYQGEEDPGSNGFAEFAAASARRLSMYSENCGRPLDSFRMSIILRRNSVDEFRALLASALASDYGSPLEVAIDTSFCSNLLPEGCFSTCRRTKSLKLYTCRFDRRLVASPSLLPNLQSLTLGVVQLDDEQVLYGFPNLESLNLEDCLLRFKKLEVSTGNFPKLKTLQIELRAQLELELQLTAAPFLERLIFSESLMPSKYKAVSSSSAPNLKFLRIVRSGNALALPCSRDLDDFVAKLPSVEVLEISSHGKGATLDFNTKLKLAASSAPFLRVIDALGVHRLNIRASVSSVKVLNLRVTKGFRQSHLDGVISKLPCLESLYLVIASDFRSGMSKIRISIPQLRVFRLYDCFFYWWERKPAATLPELELDAPNLVSVHIDTRFRLPNKINVVNVRPECRFVVEGNCIPRNTVSWFFQLRQFLSTLTRFHVALHWLVSEEVLSIDLSRVECTSPPLTFERLQLDIDPLGAPRALAQVVSKYLNGFFLVCRPKFIRMTEEVNHRLDEFMDNPFKPKDVANCCVGGKCWRHELIDAKVENVVHVDREMDEVFLEKGDEIFKAPTLAKHVDTLFVLTWRNSPNSVVPPKHRCLPLLIDYCRSLFAPFIHKSFST